MKNSSFLNVLLLFALLVLVSCSTADESETQVEIGDNKVSVAECSEATTGLHQLVYASQGICFLYPDNYDVFQGEDGGLTLYVGSLLNTEAPVASFTFAGPSDRSLEDVVAERLASFSLPTGSEQRITLGGEPAILLDNLPGQDTNRRVLTMHAKLVYELIVSRIGPDYGKVGEQAEVLFDQIIGSFKFIGVEPEAPLLAGPECPELVQASTQYTNEVAGYCLLLPSGYFGQEINPAAGENEMAFYVGSPQDVNHARLFIKVTDASGRSLEEVTLTHKTEIDAALPGSDVFWSFGYMLDGVAANQFDQVPGQVLGRHVVMVRDGRQYLLSFVPNDPAAGDAYEEMETVYKMVMDSFSFLWQS